MFASVARITLLFILSLPAALAAQELPSVRVGMLQFGTAHWELAHIRNAGLDRHYGYRLELIPLANSSAGRLALSAGSVDWIVSDWVWAAQRTLAGEPLRFIPFSTRIGELLVPSASPVRSLADLSGKRIGVAGGPQGKSWQLLQAAARLQGVDLTTAAAVSFGSPPLLGRELQQGRIDALLTFWHFAARLRARGDYRTLIGADEIAAQLGLDPALPMLGYLARASFVVEKHALANAFASSVYAAKRQLRDDRHWSALRPLMRADAEADFAALRHGYRAGEPQARLSPALIDSAVRAWPLLGGPDRPLPRDIFIGVGE
jgi:NitT/TauT family transport system substrate-binding protein